MARGTTAIDPAKHGQRIVMSRAKLIVLLARVRSPTPATVFAETFPPMCKLTRGTKDACPYYGRVRKQAKVNGMICFDYAGAVNAQRIREADARTEEELERVERFDPLARTWGGRIRPRMPGEQAKPVADTCFVEYRGRLYLEIKVQRRIEERWTLDREPITDPKLLAHIQSQLIQRGKEGRRQRVKRPVILRDYGIETLLGITFGGATLVVDRGSESCEPDR